MTHSCIRKSDVIREETQGEFVCTNELFFKTKIKNNSKCTNWVHVKKLRV